MSTGLAHELYQRNIAVIALHPGFILTERVVADPRDGLDLAAGAPLSQPAKVVAMISRDPMRYAGEIVVAADVVRQHGLDLSPVPGAATPGGR
jgi:NAD(P)-dependent dehydrogenase (short-subunit alcohol dehydrogenase family)